MCGLCVYCGCVNVWALCGLWMCECVGSVCIVDVWMCGLGVCCGCLNVWALCVLWMCECVSSVCVVDV